VIVEFDHAVTYEGVHGAGRARTGEAPRGWAARDRPRGGPPDVARPPPATACPRAADRRSRPRVQVGGR
jgi:hypothetical protein